MTAISSEPVRWVRRWEAEIAPQEHDALSHLLAAIYPDHAATFSEGRDYSGARPEGRIIGFLRDQPVAHVGFLRRTLRLDDGDDSLLCGDVGLVGVDPSHRGSGHGLLMMAELQEVFERLALPYGFLTCRPAVVAFYERAGWCRVMGQVSKVIDNDMQPILDRSPALVLPVRADARDWPSERVVVRDGLAV